MSGRKKSAKAPAVVVEAKRQTSRGSQAVAGLAAKMGFPEVGRRVGKSEAMVRHVATGLKTPGEVLRAALLEVYGIPLEWWSEPPEETKSKKPKAAKVKPAAAPVSLVTAAPRRPATVSGVGKILEALDELDRMADELRDDAYAKPADRIAVVRTKADIGKALAQLQNEGEVSERAITDSRVWRELMTRSEEVLARYPEAAQALAEILGGFGG
jgi:transcriptional regulator with XRE-family HTH domain